MKTREPMGVRAFFTVCAIALVAAAFMLPVSVEAKPTGKTHKIVFEMSVDGVPKWESVLRNAKNVQKSFGAKHTRIEIVAHGKGIGLVLGKTSAENPQIKAMIQELHQNGVIFAACQNTMTRLKIPKTDLLQVAVVVDSGVAEVVRKQEAGWSYIKSG